MLIQDNVVKQYLGNVYFITGTPCGGKTTVSRALAEKYNFVLYDVDDEFAGHKRLSDALVQPAMNQEFADADAFFLRPYKEYGKWLIENTREQLDFIILDLIRLSEKQTVICDLHLTLEEAGRITEPDHIAFLIRDPRDLIADYCNRSDHTDFSGYINSAKHMEHAKENCNKTLEYLNRQKYEAIKKSSYFWLERDDKSMVSDRVSLVAQHFGF